MRMFQGFYGSWYTFSSPGISSTTLRNDPEDPESFQKYSSRDGLKIRTFQGLSGRIFCPEIRTLRIKVYSGPILTSSFVLYLLQDWRLQWRAGRIHFPFVKINSRPRHKSFRKSHDSFVEQAIIFSDIYFRGQANVFFHRSKFLMPDISDRKC